MNVPTFALLQDTASAPAKAAEKAPEASKVIDEAMKDPARMAVKLTDGLIQFATDRGPGILAALVLFVIGWLLAGWLRRAVVRACDRAKFDITLGKFLGNISRWTVLGFVVVTCLGTVGVSTTGFAAVIGTAGLAIGLALQGNLGNLASGVLLLIFRPFKIGDAVIVAGQAGVVDGIDLFTTNLDTGDNRRIIVPNGAIFGGVIENQTRHPRRQTSVNAVVSGAADLDTTRTAFEALVKRIASTTPGALTEPAPGVALAEIAPVTWSLSVWANTPQVGAVRQALLREAKRTIDELRLAPPGPAMDVRITSMPTSG